MPELPEVETVRKGLNELTKNQFIKNGEILLESTLAYPSSIKEFSNNIKSKKISHWERRGKYLLCYLMDNEKEHQGWLGIHLRMTGQLLWKKQTDTLEKHTRFRLFFSNNQELRFVDIRTFGKVWLIPPRISPENIITGLQKLGPEPFSVEFSPHYLAEKLSKRRRNIKTLLLDQNIVAGIGNIYADEILFSSKILPETTASSLTWEQIETLHKSIIKILKEAIYKGGTTFSDFKSLLGVNGKYGKSAWVYGRESLPCLLCKTPIKKIKIAGRSCHYCCCCQK